MASQKLLLASFLSVWFKGQIGKLFSSFFLKRGMKNTLGWHFLLSYRSVCLQLDLIPFVLYREPSKHSFQVAVRSISGEKSYILLKKHRQIFFFRQKKNCAIVLVPLTSCHQLDFLLFELSVCLGPWELIVKLFGNPELQFFLDFLITGIYSSSFIFLLIPVETPGCITVFWIS